MGGSLPQDGLKETLLQRMVFWKFGKGDASASCWVPVILATQEAEIRKITVRSQPG
jgi:hypothetical protein